MSHGRKQQYIKIELYDAPTVNHSQTQTHNGFMVSATMRGGRPRALTTLGVMQATATTHDSAATLRSHGMNTRQQWIRVRRQPASAQLLSGLNGADRIGSGLDLRLLIIQDPQGVGPPQHWFVQGGTTTPFHFEFGVKGEYGAPRDLDGMVPQVYATWVNGLTPGRYYAVRGPSAMSSQPWMVQRSKNTTLT